MGRLLVTGQSGLVGSQFKGDLIALNSKVCDLKDTKSVNDVFSFYTDKNIQKEFAVDRVIHTAAKVGGVGGNMNYKGEFFYDNIMINTNVIEACRKYGIEKLVVFLSTCVFPDNVEYPLTEGKIHLGPPHFSNDAYAYAKRMAEIQIRAYREQYGLNYTSVIPTNIYGPHDNFNVENGHVLPSLIHKCFFLPLQFSIHTHNLLRVLSKKLKELKRNNQVQHPNIHNNMHFHCFVYWMLRYKLPVLFLKLILLEKYYLVFLEVHI